MMVVWGVYVESAGSARDGFHPKPQMFNNGEKNLHCVEHYLFGLIATLLSETKRPSEKEAIKRRSNNTNSDKFTLKGKTRTPSNCRCV